MEVWCNASIEETKTSKSSDDVELSVIKLYISHISGGCFLFLFDHNFIALSIDVRN